MKTFGGSVRGDLTTDRETIGAGAALYSVPLLSPAQGNESTLQKVLDDSVATGKVPFVVRTTCASGGGDAYAAQPGLKEHQCSLFQSANEKAAAGLRSAAAQDREAAIVGAAHALSRTLLVCEERLQCALSWP